MDSLLSIIFRILLILSVGCSLAKANKNIEYMGDGIQLALPLYALYETFEKGDSDGRSELFKSVFTTSALTHILKNITKKQRPDKSNFKSFPSGHTSLAFSGASFLQKRYDYGWKSSLSVYALASFVAFSRVEAKKHFVEDVLAGAFIAYGVNEYFVSTHFMSSDEEINIVPVLSSNIQGVYVIWDG